jgi:NAD-dependent SIR2 family protein deacetylase
MLWGRKSMRTMLVLTSCLAARGTDSSRVGKDRHWPSLHPTLAFSSTSAPSRRSFSTSRGVGRDDDSNDVGTNNKLASLAQKLSSNDAPFANVLVLMGAGASVSAGIPDFRTPGTGLYDSLQKYRLPIPEAIFDLDYYRQDPMPFTDLAKSIWPGQPCGPRPTLTHAFLKLLQDKNCLRRIYTQNIDGLEALAGVSDEHLVECHGHFRSASCIDCQTPMKAHDCLETTLKGEAPKCSECGSLVKPDIVFFGEELPARFQQLVDRDVEACDLLLVVGTSLLVMPVAGIPSWVPYNCPRVLLNREVVGDFAYSPMSDRDLFLEGDCDESVRKLCQLAGWEQELDDYHNGML